MNTQFIPHTVKMHLFIKKNILNQNPLQIFENVTFTNLLYKQFMQWLASQQISLQIIKISLKIFKRWCVMNIKKLCQQSKFARLLVLILISHKAKSLFDMRNTHWFYNPLRGRADQENSPWVWEKRKPSKSLSQRFLPIFDCYKL